MNSVNLVIWSAGLLLQLILVALLFRRGLASTLPVFNLILIFYVARALLLFFLHGQISHEGYGALQQFLGLADSALQIVLAVTFALYILGRQDLLHWRHVVRVAILVLLPSGIAFAAVSIMPARGMVPIDRGSAFASLLLFFVLLGMLTARVTGPHLRVVAGFVLFGLIGIAADFIRRYAAFYRQVRLYEAASYLQTAIYLAVVIYWIVSLKPAMGRVAQPADIALKENPGIP